MDTTTVENVTLNSTVMTEPVADEHITSPSVTVDQDHGQTSTASTSSGRPMTSFEPTSPAQQPASSTTSPGSGSGLIIGVVVGVILVVAIAAVVIVIVVCRCRKNRKSANEENRGLKRNSSRAPGKETIKGVETQTRPTILTEGDSPDNDDMDSEQTKSNTTFNDIVVEIQHESTGYPAGKSRNPSLWDLPDISFLKKKKKQKSEKLSPQIPEEEFDTASGLQKYKEIPSEVHSAGNSRKNSLQDVLGIPTNSYTVNPEVRKDSIFQLPDISHLMGKNKKVRGKDKNEKKMQRNSIIREEDANAQNIDNGYGNFTKGHVQDYQVNIVNERPASNIYASAESISKPANIEEEYTALQSPELKRKQKDEKTEIFQSEMATDQTYTFGEGSFNTSTHGQGREEYDADSGRYSEYVKFSPSRPTSSSSTVTGTMATSGTADQDTANVNDTDNTVQYVNHKAVARHQSSGNSIIRDGVERSQSQARNVMVEHSRMDTDGQDQLNSKDKRASSVYANLPNDAFDVDVSPDHGQQSHITSTHTDNYNASHSTEDNRPSSIYLNVPDPGYNGGHDLMNEVEFPDGYIPSQTHRPSGPYVNVPTPSDAFPEKNALGSSQEDMFKRYS